MKPRSAATFAITIAIAGVLLWLALRGVEWGRVASALANARWGGLALAWIAATAAVLLRSERWRILLKAEGPVPAPLVFWATAVGYCGNNFLPARLGELLRMRAIASKTRLSNSYVLATALTERMLDAGVLVLVSCSVLVAANGLPEWLRGAAGTMAAVSGAGLAVLVVLPRCERVLHSAIGRVPCRASLRAGICRRLSAFLLGMRTFQHAGRGLGFLGLTAVVWSIDGVAAMLVARAIAVPLSFPEGLLIVAALALSSALPSTPGAVGIYQFVAVTVMGPMGVSNNGAIAFILLYQGIVVATLVLWGAIGVWRLRLRRPHLEAVARAAGTGEERDLPRASAA